jgi:hypothetical protein
MKSLPLWLVIITWACLQKRRVWDINSDRDITKKLLDLVTLEAEIIHVNAGPHPLYKITIRQDWFTHWVASHLRNHLAQIDLLANAGLVCVVQTKEE